MTISSSAKNNQPIENSDPDNWLNLYGDLLYRRALVLLGKPEIAEDLVQDTLLAACQSQPSFRAEASIKTWLLTILKNKAIDYMRKAVRREIPTNFEGNIEQELGHFSSWGIWENVQDKLGIWNRSGYEDLESRGLYSALLLCIEKLPALQRNILKLRTIEEMPVEEICKELDLTPSNIGVLLFRARLGLRNCLNENWHKKT